MEKKQLREIDMADTERVYTIPLGIVKCVPVYRRSNRAMAEIRNYLARHMKIDPEAALRAANAKFTRRFHRIEDWLAESGKTPSQSDLAEMDALWNRAKAEEKTQA